MPASPNNQPSQSRSSHRTRRVHRRTIALWVTLVAVFITIAIVGAWFFLVRLMQPNETTELPVSRETVYGSALPASKYDLRDPIVVKTNYRFKIKLSGPAKATYSDATSFVLKGAQMDVKDCARVYQDVALSVPIPTSAFPNSAYDESKSNGTVDIRGLMPLPKELHDDDSVISDTGFLPSDGYYYVQYMGSDGKKLAKPIVQFFKVIGEDDTDDNVERLSSAPDVNAVVNDNGGVDISWSKVDGAKSYNVYAYIITPQAGKEGGSYYRPERGTITKIGTSKTTQLLSDDYDTIEATSNYDYGNATGIRITSQNDVFRELATENQDQIEHICPTSDSDACAELMTRTGGVWHADSAGRLYFAVTAVDENGHEGCWYAYDASDLVPSIPLNIANGATTEQWMYGERGIFGEENSLVESMQEYVYTFVTMANGATVPIVSEFSNLTPNANGNEHSWSFQYRAPGTALEASGTLYYTGDLNTALESIKQEAIAALPKAGGLLDRLTDVGKVDWSGYDKKKIDSDDKESPYFTFASSKFGTYLANNILNGHEVIDISDYPEWEMDTRAVISELRYQNPYLAVTSDAFDYTKRKVGEKTVLWVKYPDDYRERQQRLADFVNANVSQFQGSDRDKAIAIERFLARVMEYDSEAYAATGKDAGNTFEKMNATSTYADAWSSIGMVNGKGVCMSYAYGYQALAKAAGLDTRVVSGYVSNAKSGHAWNYVKIDGQWLLIDATWDDEGADAGTKYQLKKPADVTDHFAAWNGWTLDSETEKY
ncbi:transglutaminase [Bifidobacterium goeldii]|uniref:Transglutaminase n=1 Tax=Bifidobacterium goeldii TaxID=2306975 RepID=A0A430FKK4_9BIFI|nr:transglutaminase-like domain-containing protein [Bifidobacterium goeldii]RSX53271.1 transglutaminase [Bifidobacterium goeldii]